MDVKPEDFWTRIPDVGSRNKTADDDYWDTAHRGFDFDSTDGQSSTFGDSKLSSIVKNDWLNEVSVLKCDGLSEIAEGSISSSSSNFTSNRITEGYSSKSLKNFNPIRSDKMRKVDGVYGPEDTVKKMILGLDYSLTGHKGKKEKIALLNAAVKSHDGNAILEIVLFLRETLKKSIFQREIVAHVDAVNVYLAYLEEEHETDELVNMLLLLNKTEDAAITRYEAAVTVNNPERKLKWIENCLSTHFQLDATDSLLRQSVEQHKQILQEQILLQQYYQAQPDGKEKCLLLFEKLTGNKSVVDTSVLSSLIFCCLCCYNSVKFQLNFATPEKIKSNYNLSKKQFTWATLRALAVSEKWSDVDNLFISKNWLGGVKVRSCIAYSRILEVLFKANAPADVLKTYVSCIEDDEEKIVLAQKYSCHSVAIDVFKNSKDRVGLMKYKACLSPQSPDFYNASDLLNNPAIRWKN